MRGNSNEPRLRSENFKETLETDEASEGKDSKEYEIRRGKSTTRSDKLKY